MGRSRVGPLVLAVGLATLAVGEPARPVADVRHVEVEATVFVELGGERTLRLDLVAQKSVMGTGTLDNADGTLQVAAQLCAPTCSQVGNFSRALGPGEFAVAGEVEWATLETEVFGQPLVVRWDATGLLVVGGVHVRGHAPTSGRLVSVEVTRALRQATAGVQWGAGPACWDDEARLHDRARVDHPPPTDLPDARPVPPALVDAVALGCAHSGAGDA